MDITDYWCNLDLNDLPGEEWRDVGIVKGIDFTGYYMDSNLGRVKSLDRWVSNGKKMIFIHGAIVKQNIINTGYCSVHLRKEGISINGLVHRIVGNSFIENDGLKNKTQINHKNEIKTDNRVENLEWCTQSYNTIYGTGRERKSKKDAVQVVQLRANGEFVKLWNSITEAVDDGYNGGCICNCCRKRQKFYGGYKWMYFEEYKELLSVNK